MHGSLKKTIKCATLAFVARRADAPEEPRHHHPLLAAGPGVPKMAKAKQVGVKKLSFLLHGLAKAQKPCFHPFPVHSLGNKPGCRVAWRARRDRAAYATDVTV